MQRELYLHGELAQFGDKWTVDASTASDALRLIDCQKIGFKKFLIEAAEAGLELAMIIDDEKVEHPEELLLENRKGNMHLALMPSGSKRGWGRIILGAILIALTIFWAGGGSWSWAALKDLTLGQTMLASLGVNLMMVGLTELLAKTPKHEKEGQHGVFNGPESTLIQGTPVPIVYGQVLVGGKPISVNFRASGGTGASVGGGAVWTDHMGWFGTYQDLLDWFNDLDEVKYLPHMAE